jgi:hypothetical protein
VCNTWDKNSCNSIGVNYADSQYGKCTYNINDIDTSQQLYNITNKFDNPDITPILKNLCSKNASSGCPNDMEQKAQINCSRLLSNDFPQCKELNSQFNDLTDYIKDTYCTANPTNYSCNCINRIYSDNYKALKKYYQINDKCWWLPCNSITNNLIPRDIHNSDNCPTTLCQQVVDITDPKDKAIVENNSFILDCSTHGGGGTDTPIPTTPPTPPKNLSTNAIIAITISVFVVICIFIALMLYLFL